MKTHLHRSERSTWCGRSVKGLKVTRNDHEVDCKICLKADAAEELNEAAARQD
jgi:uncharacterized Zn ribbon protein